MRRIASGCRRTVGCVSVGGRRCREAETPSVGQRAQRRCGHNFSPTRGEDMSRRGGLATICSFCALRLALSMSLLVLMLPFLHLIVRICSLMAVVLLVSSRFFLAICLSLILIVLVSVFLFFFLVFFFFVLVFLSRICFLKSWSRGGPGVPQRHAFRRAAPTAPIFAEIRARRRVASTSTSWPEHRVLGRSLGRRRPCCGRDPD